MKILYIHNNYGIQTGEEHAAEGIVKLLKENNHTVEWYRRSSEELYGSYRKKSMAFFTGVWNPKAVKAVKKHIQSFQPDVVQVQNLYPLISPAVLKAIKKEGIPLVMRCPNYRLFCPTGLHLDAKGLVCEKCLGHGRELNCIIKNCENNPARSIGYAMRNFTARVYWDILKQIDVYIVQSDFQKQKFMGNGIPENKIGILPGLTPEIHTSEQQGEGNLVSFIGRASPEKGIYEFLEAARRLPDIPFAVAGRIRWTETNMQGQAPDNVHWSGFLEGEEFDELYARSRIIVIPGKWYEGFPNVITRAMKHQKPVITSNLGAMASIIDHKQNGLLVEPGNADELTYAIKNLYANPELCREYGKNGFEKVKEQYTNDIIYRKLMEIYKLALKNDHKTA